MSTLAATLRKLWTSSAPLTAVGIVMLAAFLFSLLGIWLDPRVITGAPAWLKPAKFGISSAIYALTLAWVFQYLTVWVRFVKTMGWLTALVLVVEVAIIDVQAGRGTTSHFNFTTPLDGALFGIMGVSIGALWLVSIGILLALFRQRFTRPGLGWALRFGMLITVLGSASGGLMVSPTSAQLAELHAGAKVRIVGAHTVGAPDGGPGLPGVGWSRRHGDLRIPHFFGLHGIQLIPLLYWLAFGRRKVPGSREVRFVILTSASYLAFVALVLAQALRGESIVSPDSGMLLSLSVWAVVTAAALLFQRPAGLRPFHRVATQL